LKQRDKRLVLTKRQEQNLRILDIVESFYQWYFHVKDINSAFENWLGRWKLNERKTRYNIPKNNSANAKLLFEQSKYKNKRP